MAVRLKRASDVRRFLARIANETYEGKLDTQTANSITTTCNAILNSIRTDEVQDQLDELTATVDAISRHRRYA